MKWFENRRKASRNTPIIFLEWRPHNRRAQHLAQDLGARLFLAPEILRRKFCAPLRYVALSIRTLSILLRTRPKVIVVTSPPPFSPILVYAYSKLFGCKYIIDAHHLATVGFWSRIPFGTSFNRFIMRKALVTLVHNEMIERMIRAEGVPAMTVETKIPYLSRSRARRSTDRAFTVLMPCSFDPDEPISAVYESARRLEGVTFYLAGDHTRLGANLRSTTPPNVILTGFLHGEDYYRLLRNCDVVLATTMIDYPVRPRAASEALAAEKPVIASQNEATESHLGQGAFLIDNTAGSIIRAVEAIRDNYSNYQSAVRRIKRLRRLKYDAELQELRHKLKSICG